MLKVELQNPEGWSPKTEVIMADKQVTYTCGSIVALSLVEAIRRRPGMYVGDVSDGSGQHELIEAVVEYGVLSDHPAGHRTQAELKLEGARGWFRWFRSVTK